MSSPELEWTLSLSCAHRDPLFPRRHIKQIVKGPLHSLITHERSCTSFWKSQSSCDTDEVHAEVKKGVFSSTILLLLKITTLSDSRKHLLVAPKTWDLYCHHVLKLWRNTRVRNPFNFFECKQAVCLLLFTPIRSFSISRTRSATTKCSFTFLSHNFSITANEQVRRN